MLDVPALNTYHVGMKKSRYAVRQYTIRTVPLAVDKALRRKAEQEGKSLNQAAIDALCAGLGLVNDKPVHTNLDKYIGTWIEDPEFDAVMAEHDVVDPEKWL